MGLGWIALDLGWWRRWVEIVERWWSWATIGAGPNQVTLLEENLRNFGCGIVAAGG
jgi:hypothetical protein